MFKSVEVFQQFGKQQMEAAAASATALSNGVQQMFAEGSEMSRKSVETGTDALQNLFASKSIDRAIQVQMDYARTTYDSMMAGSSKFGSIVSTTAQDMVKPLEGTLQRLQEVARSTTAS